MWKQLHWKRFFKTINKLPLSPSVQSNSTVKTTKKLLMFVKYHNWKIQWDLFENKYANYFHISFVPAKTKKKKKKSWTILYLLVCSAQMCVGGAVFAVSCCDKKKKKQLVGSKFIILYISFTCWLKHTTADGCSLCCIHSLNSHWCKSSEWFSVCLLHKSQPNTGRLEIFFQAHDAWPNLSVPVQ